MKKLILIISSIFLFSTSYSQLVITESISNLTKDINDGKKHFAFTLNNTACASPRILIPLMENHQTKEGHIKIPTCLQKYMNNKTLITG